MDNDDITVIKPRPGRASGKSATPQKPSTGFQNPASDQTIIKPRPRPGGSQKNPIAAPFNSDTTVIKPRRSRPTSNAAMNLKIPRDHEILKQTPLIDAASPVLSLTPQLRQLDTSIDVHTLHSHIKQLIANFEDKAVRILDDAQQRKNTSYVLCALIDEAVLNTPWGENSAWSQKPMLSIFHQETYGGEKVYSILDDALVSPVKNHDVIEIIYLALSLGFMGKLRIDPQGSMKSEDIRTQVYQVLTRGRDRLQRELSTHIAPLISSQYRLQSFLPVWIFIATMTLLAFGIYSYWLMQLNEKSDLTTAALAQLIPMQSKSQLSQNLVRPEAIALGELLAPEIAQGVLSVKNFTGNTSIALHAEELFKSGSTSIKESYEPILDKIGKALEATPGKIIVSGHTDNESIRTPRFPSNWHLSLARASAVVKYLDNVATLNARLLPEGRGANEPIASNETPEGRAKNRRVVIDVFFTNES
ncbi:MAG: type VI secretion system protein TssL, long form [Cellvibrionaceae bacterium]